MNEIGRPTQRRNSAAVRQALALASGLGGSALGGVRALYNGSNQRLVNQAVRAAHEPKNADTYNQGTMVNTNVGTPYLLNGTSQGSGGTNRTGRQFRMERLELRMTFSSASTQTYTDLIRVMVVLDKESRGAAPTTAEILENTTFGLGVLTSPYNFNNTSRFSILHDAYVEIRPAVLVAGAPEATYAVHTLKLNLGNRRVKCYNTNTGTVSDIDEGSLYVISHGAQTAALANISCYSRLVFRDM